MQNALDTYTNCAYATNVPRDLFANQIQAADPVPHYSLMAAQQSYKSILKSNMNNQSLTLPDGFVVICKEDCPTCTMIEPVLQQLGAHETPLTIFSQDNPQFPSGMSQVHDDTSLEVSYRLDIETVPTLLRVEEGREVARIFGWSKFEWQTVTGIESLGSELPDMRPGCGSKSVEPGIAEELAVRFGDAVVGAREVRIGPQEDDIEACYDREWSDGLPVVPPTPERVVRMLAGTHRRPDDVVGIVPPNQVKVTVQKVAINAVMAGCKPEYLPVVLAAVEAACIDEFCMHGVSATTYFSSPVVIVNGPITKAIGMNSGINALGPGNRANATIGRALNLVIRNVGGSKPGGVDRSAMGNPGKYTFCFAENLDNSSWESLPNMVTTYNGASFRNPLDANKSTVTLFAGDGVQPVADQRSRVASSLAKSFALSLRSVCHPKLAMAADAMLLVSPEHSRTFEAAGWSKERLLSELTSLLQMPTPELVRGVDGIEEGVPSANLRGLDLIPKFRPGGLLIARVGGTAGMFSGIVSGWAASGPRGSQPVTVEIK